MASLSQAQIGAALANIALLSAQTPQQQAAAQQSLKLAQGVILREEQRQAAEKAKKESLGGQLGALGGAALGSVVPGVGTAIGASLGGALGGAAGSAITGGDVLGSAVAGGEFGQQIGTAVDPIIQQRAAAAQSALATEPRITREAVPATTLGPGEAATRIGNLQQPLTVTPLRPRPEDRLAFNF